MALYEGLKGNHTSIVRCCSSTAIFFFFEGYTHVCTPLFTLSLHRCTKAYNSRLKPPGMHGEIFIPGSAAAVRGVFGILSVPKVRSQAQRALSPGEDRELPRCSLFLVGFFRPFTLCRSLVEGHFARSVCYLVGTC